MKDLTLDVITSPQHEMATGGALSPTSATLICGPTEALLVDTLYMRDDVEALSRRIADSGRTLTTIYVTHAHADHYFGLQHLLERFPNARAVALPAVVKTLASQIGQDRATQSDWFAGAALDNEALPEALDGESLWVDGRQLQAIDVGQGDIAHNTVLQVPSLDAIVAGDIVYNGVYPFLAASTEDQWPRWIDSLTAIAELQPRIVVAGHKRPGLPDNDPSASIGATRGYLEFFIEQLAVASDARDLVRRIQERYPDYVNPTALIASAVTAFKRRKAATAG